MTKTVIILLGPPGAGKGTQAMRLSSDLSLPHVSTGDLFRENIRAGTDLGKRARGFMDAGNLVPDEVVQEMLFERVSRDDCEGGYVLDGFPRTAAQASALADKLAEQDVRLSVPKLDVADEVVVERLSGRRTCPNGHVHHVDFSPPQQEGVCDTCGETLSQRADDQPDVIRQRLTEYHSKTHPLEEYYASQGVLRRVDGARATDEVLAELKRAVGAEEAA